MAMGMPVSTAAERRANFLRLAALVIDGGALALKTKFDAIFPPQRLTQDLQANKPILKTLGKNRVLSRVQLDLLLPAPPVNADSSTFDVCLFACLIQNLPAFGQQNFPVWTQKGLPPAGDQSLAADVQRLRFMRNKLCHATVASITDQEYIDISQEVLGAIGRQGQNPDVQALLFDFHNKTIDPAMENEYVEKLKEWERFDRQLHEAQEELKENVDAIKGEVAKCKEANAKNDQAIQHNTAKIEEKNKILEEHTAEMERITTSVDENAKCIKENKQIIERNTQENKDSIKSLRIQLEDSKTSIDESLNQIEETRTAIEQIRKEKGISSQYEALFGNSKLFFESQDKTEFIETCIYKEAQKRLDEKKIILLTGNPGEGKSSMGKQLLRTRFPANRCLNITHTTDWDYVDLSVKQPDAIIIDDIFGVCVLERGLFDYWRKKLPYLLLAARKYNIFVIVTSRQYILEESKVFVMTLPPFDQNGNKILLSSAKLTNDEKVQILESHLKAEKRSINRDSVKKCIFNYKDFQKTFSGKHRFTFGFPQCAALYSRRDDLFNDRRESFFESPYEFFKQCIEQLSEHEYNFLALILLWVNPEQELHRSKINDYFMSEEIKSISKMLHFNMNEDLVRSLEKNLESHVGGLLHFSNETGIFTFSHHVIGDMIGLVTAQKKTEFVVAHGSDHFLYNFVSFEKGKDDFKFHVPEYLYNKRLQRLKEDKQLINQTWQNVTKTYAETKQILQMMVERCLVTVQEGFQMEDPMEQEKSRKMQKFVLKMQEIILMIQEKIPMIQEKLSMIQKVAPVMPEVVTMVQEFALMMAMMLPEMIQMMQELFPIEPGLILILQGTFQMVQEMVQMDQGTFLTMQEQKRVPEMQEIVQMMQEKVPRDEGTAPKMQEMFEIYQEVVQMKQKLEQSDDIEEQCQIIQRMMQNILKVTEKSSMDHRMQMGDSMKHDANQKGLNRAHVEQEMVSMEQEKIKIDAEEVSDAQKTDQLDLQR